MISKDYAGIIAVDLDGTILDSHSELVRLINEKTGKNISIEDIREWNQDFGGYTIGDAYSDLFSDYNKVSNLKTFEHVSEALKNFNENGLKIVIATARTPEIKFSTIFSLIRNNIPFQGYYSKPAGDKYNIKEEFNIDMLIDDGPQFIKEFLLNRPNSYAVMIKRPWNEDHIEGIAKLVENYDKSRNFDKKRFFIVNDWFEVEKIVLDVFNERIEKYKKQKNKSGYIIKLELPDGSIKKFIHLPPWSFGKIEEKVFDKISVAVENIIKVDEEQAIKLLEKHVAKYNGEYKKTDTDYYEIFINILYDEYLKSMAKRQGADGFAVRFEPIYGEKEEKYANYIASYLLIKTPRARQIINNYLSKTLTKYLEEKQVGKEANRDIEI